MGKIQSVEAGLAPVAAEINQISAQLIRLHASLMASPAGVKEALLTEIEALAIRQQLLMQTMLSARQSSQSPLKHY